MAPINRMGQAALWHNPRPDYRFWTSSRAVWASSQALMA